MKKPLADLKSLPLEQHHIAFGAKMVPFGGWNMPVHFSKGILHEHLHTRKKVSIFDCSHMGQFRVRGPNVVRDLDRLFPRTVNNQNPKSCRYNFLLSEKGTVIDDLIVYRISDFEFYLVVNGATASLDSEYIQTHLSSDTEFFNESATTVKVDIQGPKSLEFIIENNLIATELPKYYRFVKGKINKIPCLISRTGYTGELGFEIYFDQKFAEEFWIEITKFEGIEPAGLGARDTLRLEMGYPLYGHELSQEITPVEAGFGRILDFDHEFVGRKAMNRLPSRKLVGLHFEGRRAVREGSAIVGIDEKNIGIVTSGSFSPSLGCAISLAYLEEPHFIEGQQIFGKVGKNLIPGKIVKVPFYRNGTLRLS